MSKRAVLYARVAYSEPGDDGSRLASQMAADDEYARARGYVIVAAISEDARSSSGLRLDRPGLTRVRAMAHAGEFDVLVVHEIGRLSRDLTQCLRLADELQGAGVEIACVLEEGSARLASSRLGSRPQIARRVGSQPHIRPQGHPEVRR
jgi:DNA invertase Pin-like site-specific DNA recombinase